MVKKFRCCFPDCKFKHDTLIVTIDHLTKEHNLKINGKKIYINKITSQERVVEDNKQGGKGK